MANPNSQVYGFCDAEGVFHAFEGEEGRKTLMALKALEEKIMAKVERSLMEMRQDLQHTSSEAGTDLIQRVDNIEVEQRDLRSKVEELSMEAFESRSDLITKIDEINREALESRSDLLARLDEINGEMLHSLVEELSIEAFESRSDLIAKIDDISREALESRTDLLASLEELEVKVRENMPTMKSLEFLEMQLDEDIEKQTSQYFDTAHQEDTIEDLKEQVSALGQKHASKGVTTLSEESASRQQKQSACDLDLSDHSSKAIPQGRKLETCWQQSTDNLSDSRVGFQNGFAAVPYSDKMIIAPPPCDVFRKKSVPFAHGLNSYRPRPAARMTSSQSMPLLTPLF
eukprot:TRINITY_DN76766_c0_g1_i1.p1 TRINITY_DN76766_c0_g1~~TRINITY_DN76766_c0_g1_i1.p1  ORF type:complete len:344 (+),score=66.12 TRINITY_DN76766_c0_g1_i1:50-1081(+)